MTPFEKPGAVASVAGGQIEQAPAGSHERRKSPDPGRYGQIVALFHAHESTKPCIF